MSIGVAILTVSDAGARGEREDRSGAAIAQWSRQRGYAVIAHVVVPDETDRIATQLIDWSNESRINVILTTGGTGLSPRDVTPEATLAVLDREAPGIAEALRSAGLRDTPFAALSRGVAGTRGSALIVNLPGSLGGVTDGLAVLAPLVEHVVNLLHGHTEH
jgi:molybdenum cofactor synthesis domain-containing protein